MNRQSGYRIVVGLLMVALAVGLGVYTYNMGFARGLAQSGAAVAARPWGPWGYGFFPFFFPFFPVFPFLFILFWFFVARALFWRGRWYRGGCRETYSDRRGRTTHL